MTMPVRYLDFDATALPTGDCATLVDPTSGERFLIHEQSLAAHVQRGGRGRVTELTAVLDSTDAFVGCVLHDGNLFGLKASGDVMVRSVTAARSEWRPLK